MKLCTYLEVVSGQELVEEIPAILFIVKEVLSQLVLTTQLSFGWAYC